MARSRNVGARGRRALVGLLQSTSVFTWVAAASFPAILIAPAAVAQSYSFTSVTIEGLQRIESGTVLSYAEIPRGETIGAGALNAAYQRVSGSGLFESVEFIPQGSTLIIRVVEFPTINVVNFEGNRRINDEVLAGVVRSQARRVYSPSTAEQDAAAIAEAYAQAGRLAATVNPRIIRRSDNRVDLVFEVREGRVVEVERLSFTGNRAYSDRRLRQVLETKQAGLFRQLIQRDTFAAERVEFDRQVLTDFYRSRGYIDFQILSVNSEISRERDAFFLTFALREGQQFRIGRVTTVSELPEANASDYEREVRVRSGNVYSPADIDNTIARLETLALRQGLDFVRVEPRITRNDADQTLDIEFAVVRGPRIFVERIDVEGNVTTLDRVVRRQFQTVEGDPFNPREIRESAERIRALRYFSNADVQAREGSTPDQVIIDVNVDEQPTGSLSFGISYGVASGTAFAVSFSETNFLGRGQTFNLAFDTGSSNSNATLTFIEPAFLGRNLRFRTDTFYRESDNDFSTYSTRTGGATLGFEFPLGELTRLGINGGIRFDSLYDVDAASSPILQAEEAIGDRYLGVLGYNYSYDTRIGGLSPNAAIVLRFGQELYGGDASYLKTSLTAIGERKAFNEDVTLRAKFEGGAINVIDGSSRVTDRFFANQMRGFEPRGIGPRDLDSTNDDPLGGNFFAIMSFEAEFPLPVPEEYGLSGGVFFDIGSVWGLDDTSGTVGVNQPTGEVDDSLRWRAAAGVSVFWTTPIGPLRFNFSTPIEKEAYDKEQNFDLTISTRF